MSAQDADKLSEQADYRHTQSNTSVTSIARTFTVSFQLLLFDFDVMHYTIETTQCLSLILLLLILFQRLEFGGFIKVN